MFRWKEEGYTLVEVLVALGILGFGLMAVATMQVTAIKTNARARGMSQGITVAQAKMEELMNFSYSGLNDVDLDGTDQDPNDDGIDDDGGNFGLNDTGASADYDEQSGEYSISWNVAVDEPSADSKIIRVIVIWTERGQDKHISLDFIKTDLS